MRCGSELIGLLSWEQWLNALAALSDNRWKSCNCSDLVVLSVLLLLSFLKQLVQSERFVWYIANVFGNRSLNAVI